MFTSVMSQHCGAKAKARVDSELPEEIEAKEGCTKDLCCHIFFFQLWQILSLKLQEGYLK